MEKTNPRQAHENGDVESLHRHLKAAVEQALLLRGSRDFASREAYALFLQELVEQKNAGRRVRRDEELAALQPLPARRLESFQRIRVQVNQGSLIRVQKNSYSVHSRLIGEQVDVRVYADRLEVWYAQQRLETLPRLRGNSKHAVNYRHVIDWLVRKPGALENYRYRDDLFPTSRFRMAYDSLRERHSSQVAAREYLAILQRAARDNESAVDDALRWLIDGGELLDAESVQRILQEDQAVPAVTAVTVDEPELFRFDCLLDGCCLAEQEVLDGCEQGCDEDGRREGDVDWSSAGVASAHVP